MVTLTEAQARIRTGMQYLTQSTAVDAYILGALKETQRDLEIGKSLPKFLMTEDATFTGLAGVATANLPADYIRLAEEHVPVWTSSDNQSSRELKIDAYGYLRQVWFGSTLSTPLAMAIRKSSIVLFPTPGDAWTVTYSYYAHAAILASPSDENVWLANVPDLLINGAGMRFAADRQDKENAAKFSTLYAANYASYLAKIVDEELQDQSVVMGGNR